MTTEAKRTYWIMGVVAATVSAATAAYLIWNHSRKAGVSAATDSVEELLDRCHDQVQRMEQRLGEMPSVA